MFSVIHMKMNMTVSVSELVYRRVSTDLGFFFFSVTALKLYRSSAENGGKQKRKGLTF